MVRDGYTKPELLVGEQSADLQHISRFTLGSYLRMGILEVALLRLNKSCELKTIQVMLPVPTYVIGRSVCKAVSAPRR